MGQNKYYLEMISDRQKRLILELQELILTESVKFYSQRGMRWLSAPVTTGTISSPMGLGSDSKPVKINLDGRETYLADSMQFLLEYGCRFFGQGCWYIMPTFRGEDVDKRHLKQFFHSEAEIPGTLDDVMDLVDDYLKFLAEAAEKLVGKNARLTQLINQKPPRITFDEAEKILGKTGIEYHEKWRNITSDGEKKLLEHFDGPVWVMHYDEYAVPFYQRSEKGKAKNADLLMGIGETVGCGERWETGKELERALKHYGLPADEYEWYFEMKKHFPLQTAGFGMGIERFLLFVLGEDDIRKMQVFRRFNDGGDIV